MNKEDLNTAVVILKNKEFKQFLFDISDIWKTSDSKDVKWEKSSELVNKLSDDTYDKCFMQLMDVVQKSKDKCEQFNDSVEQVDYIMTVLPRLNDRRELVELIIKERRENYGLKV